MAVSIIAGSSLPVSFEEEPFEGPRLLETPKYEGIRPQILSQFCSLKVPVSLPYTAPDT